MCKVRGSCLSSRSHQLPFRCDLLYPLAERRQIVSLRRHLKCWLPRWRVLDSLENAPHGLPTWGLAPAVWGYP